MDGLLVYINQIILELKPQPNFNRPYTRTCLLSLISTMSSPASNTSRSSGTDIIDHPFGPMYANQPEHSPSDPFGMLPYNRRIRATKGVVLEWDNRARALTIYYWYEAYFFQLRGKC